MDLKNQLMLEVAQRILAEKILCDHCLGRQFALLGYGLSNKKRGEIIKNALVLQLIDKLTENETNLQVLTSIALSGNRLARESLERKNQPVPERKENCTICKDLFTKLDFYTKKVLDKLEGEEYATFLVGAKMTPELMEREDNLRAKYQITTGESIKSEFTRELGKRIMSVTGKEPNFDQPEITILVDLQQEKITLQRRSLFIYGRYNKYIRTIPQTKWPCYDCNGKGCKSCNFTGKRYQESVEELIAAPVLKITKGTGTRFHGAGREDIDALMLGSGRPFVLEIREPKVRTIDLKKIERIINRKARKKVAVSRLAFSSKKQVQTLKQQAEQSQKTYRAKIELEKPKTPNEIQQVVETLKNAVIEQATPSRVLHRRANLNRRKKVFDITIKQLDPIHLLAEITGQGGLYIKELISGDGGRTKPSFSSILECEARCTELDVIKIHYKDFK